MHHFSSPDTLMSDKININKDSLKCLGRHVYLKLNKNVSNEKSQNKIEKDICKLKEFEKLLESLRSR